MRAGRPRSALLSAATCLGFARMMLLAVAACSVFAAPGPLAAHEIPAAVTVQGYVHPAGDRVLLLVRVPLESMRDMDLPLRGEGYLDLARAQSQLREAVGLWIADYVTVFEDGRRAARGIVTSARLSIPSDPSFRTYATAVAHLDAAPLDEGTDLPWQQALLDAQIEYPISSPHANFAIEPALAHLGLRTTTVLRFVPPTGGERVFTFTGNPGMVQLDPRWHHAALRFVRLGAKHIFSGIDHLLFLLCLVIPFRRLRPLVIVVTSFTVAHSITLTASALGFAPRALWFPPLIEALIALSILWMALENIIGPRLERRWLIAFGFGLVHGFGFSFLLRDSLQLAGAHLATALLAFNIGVELGQVIVLLIAIPALTLLFRRVIAERVGTVILSAFVAHTAWHWLTSRGSQLLQYDVRFPTMNPGFAAAAARTAMLALLTVAALWGLYELARRLDVPPRDAAPHSSRSADIGST